MKSEKYASKFENADKDIQNAIPEPIVLHEQILHGNMLPIGIFVDGPREATNRYGWLQSAAPLGMSVAVSWIAERGILIARGQVFGSGDLYKSIIPTKVTSIENPIDGGTPSVVSAAIPKAALHFTEFVDTYFEAVARAVAITHDLPVQVRSTLGTKLGLLSPMNLEDYATWPRQSDPRLVRGFLDLTDEGDVERFLAAHAKRHGFQER